ncbi:MAG: sterol desaturase family protein [Desulfobulbaceae bacterium]|nr:sterol desaturase family protein [Desulfobulbaceae bacterium]
MEDLATMKPFLYWGGVVFFLLLELRKSYRPDSVSKRQRWFANLPLSLVNGIVYHVLFTGTITLLLVNTGQNDQGLLNLVAMPSWLKVTMGVLLLDGSIYLWHLLNHVVPLLWRFHRVHHSDMNMDVSTANRFHMGEILLSGLVRLAVIHTFGIPLSAYLLFEILVNLSIQFHHSAIGVNHGFERLWALLFVPPFLHRIHHSVKIRERDANYGVILSLWDRMLGTLVTDVDQKGIVIGIGSHRDFPRLGFWRLMAMPFTAKSR